MAIILTVETGTGVADANTYAAAATVDTYHTNLGNSTWAGDADTKAAAILRAMRFLEGQNWKGTKTDSDYALEWPRTGVVDRNSFELDSDEIPQSLINALCEAALIELVSAGTLRPELSRGGMVQREKVDVVEIEYQPGAPASTAFGVIIFELRGLLKSTVSVALERV